MWKSTPERKEAARRARLARGARDARLVCMNAQLRNILKNAESWPEDDQQELIAFAREIEARRKGVYVLDEDERAAIEEGLAQAGRGEFATDEEVAALFKRYGA